jgi:hypothetical protein
MRRRGGGAAEKKPRRHEEKQGEGTRKKSADYADYTDK